MQLLCLREKFVVLFNFCYLNAARDSPPDPTSWWEEMADACNSIIIASDEASAMTLVANLLLQFLSFTSDKFSCLTSIVIEIVRATTADCLRQMGDSSHRQLCSKMSGGFNGMFVARSLRSLAFK